MAIEFDGEVAGFKVSVLGADRARRWIARNRAKSSVASKGLVT